MSSKITISQSEMVRIVQHWFSVKLFKKGSSPTVLTIEANVDNVVVVNGIKHGGDSFDVECDPPSPVVKPKHGFTDAQAAMIAKTADVPVELK